MAKEAGSSARIGSKIEIEYPNFAELPEAVREKFESLPTKANFFRMLGHSPGTFVPIIDLTNAIFKNLTLSDYHKEMFVLLVAAHERAAYEWELIQTFNLSIDPQEDETGLKGEGKEPLSSL